MRIIEQNGKYFGETNILGIAKAKPELKYGKVAKKLREGKGMSVNELSGALSLKARLIEEIESQTKGMTEDVMKRYCDYFEAKKEDFFDLDLEKLICGDNGVVLKTYDTSADCTYAFEKIMEMYLKDNNVLIDFRKEIE